MKTLFFVLTLLHFERRKNRYRYRYRYKKGGKKYGQIQRLLRKRNVQYEESDREIQTWEKIQ